MLCCMAFFFVPPFTLEVCAALSGCEVMDVSSLIVLWLPVGSRRQSDDPQ